MEQFKFDELYLQKKRQEFIEWLEIALEKQVQVGEIEIYCANDGKFELRYSKWNTTDQIIITRLCYANSSVDTKISLCSRTYNTSIVNKSKKNSHENHR